MARSGGTTQASLQPQKSGAGRHTIDTINKKTGANRGTIDTINRLSGAQVLAVPPDLPNSVTQGFSIEHRKILAQRDRHKSAQIGTIDTCQNEDVELRLLAAKKKARSSLKRLDRAKSIPSSWREACKRLQREEQAAAWDIEKRDRARKSSIGMSGCSSIYFQRLRHWNEAHKLPRPAYAEVGVFSSPKT